MEKKRERSENWTGEEKNFFLECVRKRKDVIESKASNIKIVRQRKSAWLEIEECMRVNGYERSVERLKEQWRRIKNSAKKNISTYNRLIKQTGGGTPPEEPTEVDWIIRDICPTDFSQDRSKYDSDAIVKSIPYTENIATTSNANEEVYVVHSASGILEHESFTPIPDNPSNNALSSDNQDLPLPAPLNSPKQIRKKRKFEYLSQYEKELLSFEEKRFKRDEERKEELYKHQLNNLKAENEAIILKSKLEKEILELQKQKLYLEINLLKNK